MTNGWGKKETKKWYFNFTFVFSSSFFWFNFFFGITYNRTSWMLSEGWLLRLRKKWELNSEEKWFFKLHSMAIMERLCCCCWLDDDKCWGECVWKGNDKLEETDWFPSDNFSHHHARLDCDTSAIGRTPLSRLRNSRSSNCFYPKNSHSIILVRGLRAPLFNVVQLCVSVLLDYSWRWIFDNFFRREEENPIWLREGTRDLSFGNQSSNGRRNPIKKEFKWIIKKKTQNRVYADRLDAYMQLSRSTQHQCGAR